MPRIKSSGATRPEASADHDTRARIFRAAAQLFADRGYNGVSMREISEYSGVSKPMIYYYFGSKEGIFSELLKTGRQFAVENLQAILASELPVRDKLVELIKTRFAMCRRHPEFVRFYFSAILSADQLPFIRFFTSDLLHPQELLTKIIRDGIEAGEFNPDLDAGIIASLVAGVQFIYIIKYLNWNNEEFTDQLAEEIVDHLMRGLSPSGRNI